MASKSETARRVESNIEKYGGAALAVVGLLTGEFPAIVGGVLIHLFGRWRSPKST